MLRNAIDARGSPADDVIKWLRLLGRFGTFRLCSDQSTFTVGHVLAVYGGYLSR